MASSNNAIANLARTTKTLPAPPCGGCAHYRYCRDNDMACQGFRLYCNQVGGKTGRHNPFSCWAHREQEILPFDYIDKNESASEGRPKKDKGAAVRSKLPPSWSNLMPVQEPT